MNIRNRELAGLVAFCAALAALVGSILAGHAGAPGRPAVSPRPARRAGTAPRQVAARPALQPGSVAPKLSSPSAPPAPKRAAAKRRPTAVSVYSRGPLPPLLPPLSAPVVVGSPTARPAPPALRLTGIVGGAEKLAVLRRGERRFMVRVGDSVEAYRVSGIGDSSVTLQQGRRTRILRLVG